MADLTHLSMARTAGQSAAIAAAAARPHDLAFGALMQLAGDPDADAGAVLRFIHDLEFDLRPRTGAAPDGWRLLERAMARLQAVIRSSEAAVAACEARIAHLRAQLAEVPPDSEAEADAVTG